MNNSKKSHDLVRQNEKVVKKSQKHDVNLRKNSTLYFQIGLIVCLLGSYTALEMMFASTNDYVYKVSVDPDDDMFDLVPDNYVIEKPKEAQKSEPVKPEPIPSSKIEISDDDTKAADDLAKTFIDTPKPNKRVPEVNPNDFKVTPPTGPVSILAVQKVPVYPGCEKATNNDARRKCMSDKLSKLIQNKFNPDLGAELGLQGRQKIWVQFKINKQGEVEILNTRSPHEELDKEAIRVVEKIPTMTPGMNDERPVEVSYMLPINLNIQN
ncbi:energy transducer TonB [Lacinutrix sp. Hel_I_90]|uniref:energy transducer TonB n=1 Tax=Lacinutrix sp. Hel_I_90 TaxID=1249999 RepID=UPI0005C88F5B|nr:energy transducer TonB [Lacinutrix sp. Hel_I_90]